MDGTLVDSLMVWDVLKKNADIYIDDGENLDKLCN